MLQEAPQTLAQGIQAGRNNAAMTNPSYPQGKAVGGQQQAQPVAPAQPQAAAGNDYDSQIAAANQIQDPAQRQAALQEILAAMDAEIQQVAPALQSANKQAELGNAAPDQQELQDKNAALSKSRYSLMNTIQAGQQQAAPAGQQPAAPAVQQPATPPTGQQQAAPAGQQPAAPAGQQQATPPTGQQSAPGTGQSLKDKIAAFNQKRAAKAA
jgi:hypothetical protein